MAGLSEEEMLNFPNLILESKVSISNKPITLYLLSLNAKANSKLLFSPVQPPTQKLIMKGF